MLAALCRVLIYDMLTLRAAQHSATDRSARTVKRFYDLLESGIARREREVRYYASRIGVTPKLSEVVKPILVVGASAVIPGGCIAWVLGRDSFVATVAGSALSVLVFACVCWLFRDRLHLTGLGSLAKNRRG